MPKINIDQLAIEVMQELAAYREDVQEAVEKAVKETAKQTAAELRSISPEGDTGEYAKHWSYKRDKNLSGRHRYDMVVYSMGNRSRGGTSVACLGLGRTSAGRGVPVQSHAGCQGTVYRKHEGVPQPGGRPHRGGQIQRIHDCGKGYLGAG